MAFIKLTEPHGGTIWVNGDHVILIRVDTNGSLIYFDSEGLRVVSKESPDYIAHELDRP